MRTTHSMSYSGRVPGGDPPTSKELWRQDLLRMRSPCLEFATSWECGRETPAHPAIQPRLEPKERHRRGPLQVLASGMLLALLLLGGLVDKRLEGYVYKRCVTHALIHQLSQAYFHRALKQLNSSYQYYCLSF